MERPTAKELAALFKLLNLRAPHLSAVCRWLVLGPELAGAILADLARAPRAAELVELLRLLRDQAPGLLSVGIRLGGRSEHAAAVLTEFQLDQLIAADADAWAHPTQILERPRADFEDLLHACRERRRGARGKALQNLRKVEAKLERAARIAASARRRRQRMRKEG